MKTSLIVGRIIKVSAVVVVTATITWQARTEHLGKGDTQQDFLTQQAGFIPQPWAEYRQAQVTESSRSMPNRFALSKAYYGTENAMLEAAALDRLRTNGDRVVSKPKS